MSYGIGALCEDEQCTCNEYSYNVTTTDNVVKCEKQIGKFFVFFLNLT